MPTTTSPASNRLAVAGSVSQMNRRTETRKSLRWLRAFLGCSKHIGVARLSGTASTAGVAPPTQDQLQCCHVKRIWFLRPLLTVFDHETFWTTRVGESRPWWRKNVLDTKFGNPKIFEELHSPISPIDWLGTNKVSTWMLSWYWSFREEQGKKSWFPHFLSNLCLPSETESWKLNCDINHLPPLDATEIVLDKRVERSTSKLSQIRRKWTERNEGLHAQFLSPEKASEREIWSMTRTKSPEVLGESEHHRLEPRSRPETVWSSPNPPTKLWYEKVFPK